MALVINDRVRETSTTTGTGTFTLAGAVQGFETFSSAIGNTNTTYYAISNQANGEFEVGLGTVGAGTLARTTIISSSNSDSAVDFSAGTKDVFCTLPASKAVILDSSGNIVANNGSNLTALNATQLTSGTIPDARFPATLPAANGSALTDLNASNLASGTVPIARIDLNLLTTSTADGDGDFFVVVDSVGAEKKLTKGNINISGFSNDSGFTTNTGTVTSVSGGDGLTGTVTTSGSLAVGAGTLIDVTADAVNVDLSELSTSTTNGDGDYFVVVDTANAQRKLTKGNINISGFNNDAGYTSNVGDITGVTAGTNLTGGGTSGDVTINMATGGIGAGTYGSTADATKIDTITVDAYGRVTAVATGSTGNGDITGVTAGSGLTGGGSSGSVTLNVGAGTGIDVAADTVAVDVSDFMSNGSNNRVVTATGADAMNAETNLVYDGSQFGINLSSPTRALDVSSSQIIVAQFTSTNASFSRILIPNGGSNIPYFGSFVNDARINGSSIVFQDGATERMRITESSGATRVGIATASPGSTLDVNGSLSKSSGSFKIDHPLESKKNTHHLVHSFVEAPQADNIYRGKINLVNGTATVNIDTVAGMSEGTFVLLNREIQCFTSNETGWTAVKGSVSGNILTITAQDNICTDAISWMVIGERHDDHMYDTEWTDENGKVIVEPLK